MHAIKQKQVIFTRLLITLSLALIVSACQTSQTARNAPWPTELPSKSYFINKLQLQPAKFNQQHAINDYLTWVKRFYLGSSLYNNGWIKISTKVIEGTQGAEAQNRVRKKMRTLGKEIAAEWALDNSIRNINTNNIITWGNALEQSIQQNQQLSLIEQVQTDVRDLISQTITPSQIHASRYYSAEDYDDF